MVASFKIESGGTGLKGKKKPPGCGGWFWGVSAFCCVQTSRPPVKREKEKYAK